MSKQAAMAAVYCNTFFFSIISDNKRLIPLEYTFKHPTKTYLNFTVELIVGEIVLEKQGRRYVQYSIELMEIKKVESS